MLEELLSIRVKKAEKAKQPEVSIENAMSVFTNADLTVNAYKLIAEVSNFPTWYRLRNYIADSLPDEDDMNITETFAALKLQAMLDNTAKRICSQIDDNHFQVFDTLIFIFKWGFDGSSQTVYQLKRDTNTVESETEEELELEGDDETGTVGENEGGSGRQSGNSPGSVSEEYAFDPSSAIVFAAVPLKLLKSDGTVIWKNPMPNSPKYCRPFKFFSCKETIDFIVREKAKTEREIETLKTLPFHSANIRFQMELTMVDGKVSNALRGNKSSVRCSICGHTGDALNHSLPNFSLPPNINFCFSPLHIELRMLDFFFNIAMRLDVKVYRIFKRNEADKNSVETRKKMIQKKLKEDLKILVGFVRPGSGNTNTGNTFRAFFAEHSLRQVAQITGLDYDILENCRKLCLAMRYSHIVDGSKFELLCKETLDKIRATYSWYPLSPSMHKLLVHGHLFLESGVLSMNEMAEDSLESFHKVFKKLRRSNARLTSFKDNNRDLFHRLLLKTDPLIANSNTERLPRSTPQSIQELLKSVQNVEVEEDVAMGTGMAIRGGLVMEGLMDMRNGMAVEGRMAVEGGMIMERGMVTECFRK